MNDERCDRDRVTAIAELAPCDYEHGREGQVCHCHDEYAPALLARLLEALDTIDRTGSLHFPEYYGVDLQRCVHDQHPWPCPTWQALNE